VLEKGFKKKHLNQIFKSDFHEASEYKKNLEPKNCYHSFWDIEKPCTIPITSGFEDLRQSKTQI
jgi:hypothetical protein